MMDGLVFKEVTLKDAKTLTDYFRLEAEYYNSISIETKNIYSEFGKKYYEKWLKAHPEYQDEKMIA